MTLSKNAKDAIMLGALCAISYLAVYFAKNILGAVTPQLIGDGIFTAEYIGKISSLYFIFYAVGQLINGILGDKIKARYMLSGCFKFSFCLCSRQYRLEKSCTCMDRTYGYRYCNIFALR